jgi:hypothetical protein
MILAIGGAIHRARMVSMCLGFLLGAWLCHAESVTAAPGDLDRSFGTNGVVRPGHHDVLSVAVGPENAVFLLERSSCADLNCQGLTVVRYRPNGSLDRAFGAAANMAEVPMSTMSYGNSSFAVDSQGRPVIAVTGPNGIVVARLQANGKADPRFGTNGRVSIAPSFGGGIYTPSRRFE